MEMDSQGSNDKHFTGNCYQQAGAGAGHSGKELEERGNLSPLPGAAGRIAT